MRGPHVSLDHPSGWFLKGERERRLVKKETIMLKDKVTESRIVSKAPKELSRACWFGT